MCMHAWLIDDRRIDACLGELHFLMNIILSWMVKFSSMQNPRQCSSHSRLTTLKSSCIYLCRTE
jgi:hypothetical protein